MNLNEWQRNVYESIVQGKPIPKGQIHHSSAVFVGRCVGFVIANTDKLIDKTPLEGVKNSFITGLIGEINKGAKPNEES